MRRSSTAVRTGGDRALLRFARRFDGADGPLEVTRDEMRGRRGPRRSDGAARDRPGRRQHRARRLPPDPAVTADIAVAPGVSVEQRVEPLARVGCYVPGGRFPLPSSLLMTAVPARVAGVREIIAVCPRPEPAVMAAALEAGVTRLFRVGGAHADRRARLRHATRFRAWTRSSGPATATSPRPRRSSPRDCAIDFYAGPTEIVIVAGGGRAGLDRRRSRRAGRARSRRAVDLHHLEPSARRARRDRPSSGSSRRAIDRPAVARRARRRRSSRESRTRRWRWRTGSRRSTWSSIANRSSSGR